MDMIGLIPRVVLMPAILGVAVYLNMRTLKLEGQNKWSIGLLLTDVWVIGYTVGVWLVTFLYAFVEINISLNLGLAILKYLVPIYLSLAILILYFLLKIAVCLCFDISKDSRVNAQIDKNYISWFLGIGILGFMVSPFVFGEKSLTNIGILLMATVICFIQIYRLRSYLSSKDIGWQLLAYGFALPLLSVGLYELTNYPYVTPSMAIVSLLLGLSVFLYYYKKKMPNVSIIQ